MHWSGAMDPWMNEVPFPRISTSNFWMVVRRDHMGYQTELSGTCSSCVRVFVHARENYAQSQDQFSPCALPLSISHACLV